MAHVVHCTGYRNSPLNCNWSSVIAIGDWVRRVFADELCTRAMPGDDCNSALGPAFEADLDWFVKRHV